MTIPYRVHSSVGRDGTGSAVVMRGNRKRLVVRTTTPDPDPVRAELSIIVNALRRTPSGERVILHLSHPVLDEALGRDALETWRWNSWRREGNKPLEYPWLWRSAWELIRERNMEFRPDPPGERTAGKEAP